MRWCSFTTASGGPGRLGAVTAREGSGRVLDVGAWARSRDAETPVDLVDLVESSPATQERVTDLARSAPEDGLGWVRAEEVRFLAPLRAPNSLRGFAAFPGTTEAGRPVFAYGNRRSVLGTGDTVTIPSYTKELDYEAEVAVVVGRAGRDLDASSAGPHVFGYTLMNDWTARDLETEELAAGLGPAKAKGVATSLGPWVVTPDEWDPDDGHAVTVLVDGEPWSAGSTDGRRWSFGEMLAWASQDEDLWPTDILGCGTFAGGSARDLGRLLVPGQQVVLAVAGLGELSNPVGLTGTTDLTSGAG